MQAAHKIMFEGDYVIYLMWYAGLSRHFSCLRVKVF